MDRLWDPAFEREVVLLLEEMSRLGSISTSVLDELTRGPQGLVSDDHERVEAAEQAQLRRLAAVKRGGSLSKALADRLESLLEKYPAYKGAPGSEGETLEVGWIGLPEPEDIDFSTWGVKELVEIVLVPPSWDSPRGRALDSYLESLRQSEPQRLFQILTRAAGEYEPSIRPGSASQGQPPALEVIDKFPLTAAQLLRGWAKHNYEQSLIPEAARVWDALVPLTAIQSTSNVLGQRIDKLTEALNHPLGDLTQALFEMLFRGPIDRDSGLDARLRVRLAALLQISSEHALGVCRPVIASRLFPLHFAEPGWVRAHVLGLLDWSDPDVSAGCWQGYLWHPELDDRLFADLKGAFLETFRHWDDLARSWEQLCGLLVSLTLDAPHLLSREDSSSCLRAMPEEGLSRVAWLLAKRLEDSGEDAGRLWTDRIGRWILDSWPREVESRSSRTTAYLAWMLTKTGHSFADAVDALLSTRVLVRADDHLSYAVNGLLDEEGRVFGDESPESVIRLLHAIVPKDVSQTDMRTASLISQMLERILGQNQPLGASEEARLLRSWVSVPGLS